MSSSTDIQTDFELHVSRIAGKIHGQVMDKIMPWIRADVIGRKKLVNQALNELKNAGKISSKEFETLRELTEDLERDDATRPAILKKINTLMESGIDSQTPLYATLLSISANSVERWDGTAVGVADAAGGILGAAVTGTGLGAVAGAVALSAFEANAEG